MRRVAHLSDIHFGALDAPVAAALVPYLNGLSPDVLVMSGDFTMRARPWQYRQAMNWLGHFDVRQLHVPGNHDVPLIAVWERAIGPFWRYKRWVSADLSPTYEDDELLIFGVNSTRAFVPLWNGFWKDGSISPRGVAHVRQYAASPKHKVLVTHHPFVQPPGKRADGVILGGAAVLPELADAGVGVALAGHLHASYHQLLPAGNGRHVLSVQSATTTSFRRRRAPDGTEYPNGFNLLTFDGGNLTLDVHEFRESSWRASGRTVFARTELGWQIRP